MAPAVKLAGFLILLAAIFAGAHAAGARVGPVTTSHSQVEYDGSVPTGDPGTGGTHMGGMNGMNMGGNP